MSKRQEMFKDALLKRDETVLVNEFGFTKIAEGESLQYMSPSGAIVISYEPSEDYGHIYGYSGTFVISDDLFSDRFIRVLMAYSGINQD